MLTRPHRLTESRGFVAAIRKGRRAGTSTLVLHLLTTSVPADHSEPPGSLGRMPVPSQDRSGEPPKVGFVVGKAVGPAVTRNLVKRRLRALTRERLGSLPRGSTLVVRALPPAAHASYSALGTDMDRALSRATGSTGPTKRP